MRDVQVLALETTQAGASEMPRYKTCQNRQPWPLPAMRIERTLPDRTTSAKCCIKSSIEVVQSHQWT